MSLVADASVVVAALVDGGPVGTWAASLLASDDLAAPQLMPVEAANILRRSALVGDTTDEVASLAHADLLELRVALFPYGALAERVWELRRNVTAYDALYVALAEALQAPLATLDARLTRAPGLGCALLLPTP